MFKGKKKQGSNGLPPGEYVLRADDDGRFRVADGKFTGWEVDVGHIVRATVEQEPLHPVGLHFGKIVEVMPVIQSVSREHNWLVRMKLKTEHGSLFTTYMGMWNTAHMIYGIRDYLMSIDRLPIKVTHKCFDGVHMYAQADINWPD